MKLFTLLIMCLYSSATLANDYFNKFTTEVFGSNLYVIHGPLEMPNAANRGFMNNPAFIVGKKSVVVVDPGSSYEVGEMVLREIAKVTSKPVTHIFNTHIHGDHWLANDIIKKKYPKVKIYADPRMIKKAKSGAGDFWIDNMNRLTDGITKGTKIAYPDEAVTDGKTLTIDEMTFKIYSVGIAHSDSDIMIEYVEGAAFFTGDNVGYLRILRIDDGSFRDTVKALDKAISLQLKYYIPGHGPTGAVQLVEMQREYLDVLYKEVEKHYEEGLEDFEMKPKVEAALTKFKSWAGFDEQLGRHISLAKLEVEKAEFE